MRKLYLIMAFAVMFVINANAQQTISDARAMGEGETVTVTGVVTNGSELGIIRYLQDETGGIAAYSDLVTNLQRGDKVTITGELKSYNQLLEIDPVTSVDVLSSSNTYEIVEITASQMSEQYEGMLVKIKNATFNEGGQTFSQQLYNFSSGGEQGAMYASSSNVQGEVVPVGAVDLVGICSQFHYSNPNDGYQLLPRDMNDFISLSAVGYTKALQMSNLAKDGFTVEWTTDKPCDGELFYGYTPECELGSVASGTAIKQHSVTLTGLDAGEIVYVKAVITKDNETVETPVDVYATQSNSTGNIEVFFNFEAETSVAIDKEAQQTRLDQLLVEYINKAKYTIDATIYNFNDNNIADISKAFDDAAARGVRVRLIACGTNSNFSFDELSDEVNKILSPGDSERDGIMHNKFIVFDAESTEATDSYVWTGGTNWTQGQMIDDLNDVIIIQDQSLARTYQIEFVEMWGSNTETPNATNAKFGEDKSDNTPHEFIIGGKRVECYFSPSDGVNDKIIELINTADIDLSIQTMLITRRNMAYAIEDKYENGIAVNILTNAESQNDSQVNSILSVLGNHYVFDDVIDGIMHTKFMVIDQSTDDSDPMLLTGSHNWSNSANVRNDENTMIIHDQIVANIYYQMFYKRFLQNNGSFEDVNTPPDAIDDAATTQQDTYIPVYVLSNDDSQMPLTVTITSHPSNGTATLNYNNTITYNPSSGYYGNDSFEYQICYSAFPDLCDVATVNITIEQETSVAENNKASVYNIYPNPANKSVFIVANRQYEKASTIELFSATGQLVGVYKMQNQTEKEIATTHLQAGVYFLKISNEKHTATHKLLVK